MEKEIKVWLSDIKQAISEINQFLSDKKVFQDFQKDLKAKRAIEKPNLESKSKHRNNKFPKNS